MHDNIISQLEFLGLSKAEAITYLSLLKAPNSNGSQLSKNCGLPKPSVYLALDKLYQRGMIVVNNNETRTYIALEYQQALNDLSCNYAATTSQLINSLNTLNLTQNIPEFYQTKGAASVIATIKKIILNARSELYIQTNLDLNIFKDELTYVSKAGVRIILNSFARRFDYDFILEEYFDSNKPQTEYFRLHLVSDYKECIIASGKLDSEMICISTTHPMQVSLIAENIHNAIYWIKLFQLYPNFTYPCRLDTKAEQDIQISGYQI